MTATVLAVLSFGILACCLADPVPSNDIKWCTTSVPENKKCVEFKNAAKDCKLSCVQKSNIHDCIKSISDSEADAITLDGGHVYDAGLQPYNLKPIMSEDYGTGDEKDTCYFAVVVAKKNTKFTFAELKGKKSCHTGLGKTAGWNVPIGTLVESGYLLWDKVDPIEKAVSEFFNESCVPGAKNHPNLCSLCKGKGASKCTLSDDEPYNGYSGAYKCLADGAGDVAFVKHSTVPAGEAEGYELLCLDNTRKPISEYTSCNLARVPAHAVVTRNSGDKTEAIRQCLTTAQEIFGKKTPGSFHLFSSSYGKDLLFKDSAKKLLPVPNMDAALYLGAEYNHAIRGLKQSSDPSPTKRSVRLCTVKKAEKQKCDEWSLVSGDAISCGEGDSTDDCIAKIQKGDMDAVTLDGGFVYTAGKCGLVPVMGEYYDTGDLTPCTGRKTNVKGTYFAVAIVKASNKKITWETMKGKTSCHTAVGRTAGFIIPVGLMQQQNKIKDCKVGEFFSKSCAPGSDPSSNLCDLCIGSPGFKDSKCQPNSKELYYGYSGAFRCMVEGGGDVAFAKHTTTSENTNGNNPANWAKDLKPTDFELMCLDGTRAPVTEYKKCHLAEVPAHAVMTRPEKRDEVVQILTNQQSLYGRTGTEKDIYQMFVSGESKDLLFKDSTQCLIEVPRGTSTKDFLGQEYHNAVAGMTACSSPSELLKACTFHSCS